MSAFISFPGAGGGGSIENLDTTYEWVGIGSGDGTLITGSAAHAKGEWIPLEDATASSWAGFDLLVGPMSSGSMRAQVDVSIDGGATVHAPNLYVMSGTAGRTGTISLPLNVPSGSDVRVRMQTGGSAQTLRAMIRGRVRTAGSRPGYDYMVALNADTAATYPDNADILLTGAYTELVASTAQAYGALLGIAGPSTLTPALAQAVTVNIAVGAASAETVIDHIWATTNTANPFVSLAIGEVADRAIPAGSRLSAAAIATTPGSDAIRVALYGFY